MLKMSIHDDAGSSLKNEIFSEFNVKNKINNLWYIYITRTHASILQINYFLNRYKLICIFTCGFHQSYYYVEIYNI